MPSKLQYCVYVLVSHKDGKMYIGFSTDLKQRLTDHFNGRVDATARRRPLELIFCEYHKARSDALRREKYFNNCREEGAQANAQRLAGSSGVAAILPGVPCSKDADLPWHVASVGSIILPKDTIMVENREIMRAVLQELKALKEKSFPKICTSCGKTYANINDFLDHTKAIPHAHGLLDGADYEDHSVVDLIRECSCGSTLMAVFDERRDMSDHGIAMREKFGRLLDHLIVNGVARDVARTELLKHLHGEDTPLLREYGLEIKDEDP